MKLYLISEQSQMFYYWINKIICNFYNKDLL